MKEHFENIKPRIKRIDRIQGMIWDGLCQTECNHIISIAPELEEPDRKNLRKKLFNNPAVGLRGIPHDWGARTGFTIQRLNRFDHDLDVAPGYCAVD
jgi:hypothetical protein